jgi:hypothetical protein
MNVDRIWPQHIFTNEALRQANIEKWKRAVAYLGDRWILTKKVQRTGVAECQS